MAKKILVVDDEVDILLALQKRLESHGYEVLTATSSHEALEIVRQIKPDLIILDMMMPVMDGMQFSKILRSEAATQSIPIIFLTALESKDQEGGEIIFSKPFDSQKLLERIEALIGV